MKYVALCQGCPTVIRFGTHTDRADWVGKHRVRTGHDVKMEQNE